MLMRPRDFLELVFARSLRNNEFYVFFFLSRVTAFLRKYISKPFSKICNLLIFA